MGTGNVNKAKETAISRTPDDDEKDTGAFFLNGTDHDHFQRSDNNAIQRKDDTDEKFVEVPFLLEKQGCDPEQSHLFPLLWQRLHMEARKVFKVRL
jgi:hypothetical protein